PYTVGLLRSMPSISGDDSRLVPIAGQPPNPTMLPSGCSFHPRCPIGASRARCRNERPELMAVAAAHVSACHFPEEAGTRPPLSEPALPAAPLRPAAATAARPLLAVDSLEVRFVIRSGLLRRPVGYVRAVDGVSLRLAAGETLGLVGESGCGKTTTGRAIMGLIPAAGGRIAFDGEEITGFSRARWRRIRRQIQYVFQDPYASLNPTLTAGDIVAEPLRIHGLYERAGGAARIAELFGLVGLSRLDVGRYPREFSGGQKQRIGIARALSLKPRLLILDEPVAALDVSIQAQIINLLQDLQQEFGLAYLFIAHDLSVVRQISDRVAVMYLGRIVEESTKATVYATPVHPYTQSLLSAVPATDPAERHNPRRIILKGEIPNPASPPSGCTFHPRCFRASAICSAEGPAFVAYPGLPTRVACHHAGPLGAQAAVPAMAEPAGGEAAS
ncbi:MAG: oligopeptide/dipeptide ABC transporter ATP-binding protein, partial [Acetobacteraceae bacterium]